MFCPKCSQPLSDDGTQFCSKCGFSTKNVKDFVKLNGKIETEELLSKRQKGIKQGLKLIVLSLILLPAFLLLIPMFPPNDTLVESSPSNTWFEQIGWALLWILALTGVARIALTLIFEQKGVAGEKQAEGVKQIEESRINQALPPTKEKSASNFGKWKITDELSEPVFVKQKTSGGLK